MPGLSLLAIARCAGLTCCLAAMAGCAYTPVAAWDKGDLARPEMQFDADRLGLWEAPIDRGLLLDEHRLEPVDAHVARRLDQPERLAFLLPRGRQ